MDARLSRTTDPETSHEAAAQTKAFRARHIATIYAALQTWGDMTTHEISAVTDLDYIAVARRMAEMADRLLVERTDERRMNANGRRAVVWRAK